METQIALLRVLRSKFERSGRNQPIEPMCGCSTTNRDLQAAIAAGNFRRDLFYRLNVFPIGIPPLRERQEDVPILVEYLSSSAMPASWGRENTERSRKTMDLLQSYSWPAMFVSCRM